MSAADFQELLMLWLFLPINLFSVVVCLASGLFVYVDAQQRSKSHVFAGIAAILVSFVFWPVSFIVYLWVTIRIDRSGRQRRKSPAS